MLRATILARVRALGGQADEVVASPLPEAGAYLVRLPGREQAERVAAGLRGDGGEKIRRADAVGEGLLFITPGVRAYEAALSEVADGSVAVLPGNLQRKVLLEFVSADPHGPLTLTHAREAVLGDALARLLTARGHTVRREFYLNDAPNNALRTFAHDAAGKEASPWAANVAAQTSVSTLASLVAAARALQGETLGRLGITFDGDTSELVLRENGAVERTLSELVERGFAETRGDSLWLRSSALGDDQDRVLKRGENATYLAGDLAYHRDKLERGFNRLIDLWDADHKGYIARTHAGLTALGSPPDALKVLVCGPVRCLKDGTEVRGGRYGSFVSLEEVLEESAPNDLRWRLLRAAPDSTLDLPLGAESPLSGIYQALALAKQAASENTNSEKPLEKVLESTATAALLGHLLEWPRLVQEATDTLEPYRLALWAEALAARATAPGALTHAQLAEATARVLTRTLTLSGLTEEANHA